MNKPIPSNSGTAGQDSPALWQAAGALDCILISGADAEQFLQAQLTCDVGQLTPAASLPFAWCSPAGRVRYSGWLAKQPGGFCMLLAAGAATACMNALSRFILRAKVRLASASEAGLSLSWQPYPGEARPVALKGELMRCLLPGRPERLILLSGQPAPSGGENTFLLTGIRAGVCELPAALTERFLPQMLNLDLIGGISFTKGCYPGQELVARTHHLGRVKRRLLRFTSLPNAATLGTDMLAAETVVGTTVAVAHSAQLSELLAVVNLAAAARSGLVADTPTRPALTLAALPYALPEPADAR